MAIDHAALYRYTTVIQQQYLSQENAFKKSILEFEKKNEKNCGLGTRSCPEINWKESPPFSLGGSIGI